MKRSVKIIIGILICLFLIGCENENFIKDEIQLNLTYGNIDIKTLKENFNEIYSSHESNLKNFTYEKEIQSISYSEGSIVIGTYIKTTNDIIYFSEDYNTIKNKLIDLIVVVPNNDKELVKEFVTKIASLESLNTSTSESKKIEDYFLNGTPTVDNCQNINNFCISKRKTDLLDTYRIIIK